MISKKINKKFRDNNNNNNKIKIRKNQRSPKNLTLWVLGIFRVRDLIKSIIGTFFISKNILGTNALREGSYFGGWEKKEPTDVWEEDVPEAGEGMTQNFIRNF